MKKIFLDRKTLNDFASITSEDIFFQGIADDVSDEEVISAFLGNAKLCRVFFTNLKDQQAKRFARILYEVFNHENPYTGIINVGLTNISQAAAESFAKIFKAITFTYNSAGNFRLSISELESGSVRCLTDALINCKAQTIYIRMGNKELGLAIGK